MAAAREEGLYAEQQGFLYTAIAAASEEEQFGADSSQLDQ